LFIAFVALTLGANGICVAWTTGGHNQLANLVAAKLDWTGDQTRFYNSLINLASMIGKTLGAMVGGQFIQKGRKK
jgi:predicted MFS family arabinose efflux permease